VANAGIFGSEDMVAVKVNPQGEHWAIVSFGTDHLSDLIDRAIGNNQEGIKVMQLPSYADRGC
jgi:hypothetical protein